MTEATALVPTANGARYMTQLCKHWSHRFEVQYDQTKGRVSLPGGDVELVAGDDALQVTIHPKDEEALERMKTVVAEHLDRFAFREAPLTYDWK